MPILRSKVNIFIHRYIPTILFGDTVRMFICVHILHDFYCYLHWSSWKSLKTVYIPILFLHSAATIVRGIATSPNETVWPADCIGSRSLQGSALGSAELDPYNHEAEHNSNYRTCRLEKYVVNLRFGKIRDKGCECESPGTRCETLYWCYRY